MNVHSINNLVTWNIPYIIGRVLKLLMTVYFMYMISIKLTAMVCIIYAIFRFFLMSHLEKIEKNTHKMERKFNILCDQTIDEAFAHTFSIKLFSKEEKHIEEHENACSMFLKNLNSVVVNRCIREFLYGSVVSVSLGAVLFSMIEEKHLNAGNLTAFFLLFSEF